VISTFIGLGNIGSGYNGTRHNLGFEVLNQLCRKWDIKPQPGRGDYFIAEKTDMEAPIRLVWPTTFMNNSGLAVAQILEHFDLNPNLILILCDDINLELGKIRIRSGGSAGGHKGLESIIYHLGTDAFPRLRMGIGPLPDEIDQIEFVLGRFNQGEMEILKKMLVKSGEAVVYLLRNRPEEAMRIYNSNPASDLTQ